MKKPSEAIDSARVLCYDKGMKNTAAAKDFQTQIDRLEKRNLALENTVAELSALVRHFEELFKISQQKRFGASSEKSALDAGQTSMFEESVPTLPPALEIAETSRTRRKQKGKREADWSRLPLEIIEHDIPEPQRKCPACSSNVAEIGVQTRDELKIIPAQVIRVQHRVKVYKCPACDVCADKTPIFKAKMPVPLIRGSIASPSAVTHIMVQKHLLHLPFYRQEQEFPRQGVAISRQNMANWSIQTCEDWLRPMYDKLRENLLRQDILHADETTLQVLKEPGKAPETKSYMWLYRTGDKSPTPTALYEYQQGRGTEHPKAFFDGWHGFCHTDGYSAYRGVKGVTLVGCWAHVRRKFHEAWIITKALDSPAKIGLDYCDSLFALEREFSGLPPDERHRARLEQSQPLEKAFFAWAKTQDFPPKLVITRALIYAIKQESRLMNVFCDGRLELSNNRAERSIKPFVIGRKNWLFCDSVRGAKSSAIAFSIIETAKENGLKPFEYLKFLLEALPQIGSRTIDNLLPWGGGLPSECRT